MIVGEGNCSWLEDSSTMSNEMCERANTSILPETPSLANDEISMQLWSDLAQTSLLTSCCHVRRSTKNNSNEGAGGELRYEERLKQLNVFIMGNW